MHPIILQFLKDWLAWVEDGAIEPHFYFSKRTALCSAFSIYVSRRCNHSLDEHIDFQYLFQDILRNDFPKNHKIPFNVNGSDYMLEEDKTKNTKRVDWVKEKIANA